MFRRRPACPLASPKGPERRVPSGAFGFSLSILLLSGAKTLLYVPGKSSRSCPCLTPLLRGSSAGSWLLVDGRGNSSGSESIRGVRDGIGSLYRRSDTCRMFDLCVVAGEHVAVKPLCRLATGCTFGAPDCRVSAWPRCLFDRCEELRAPCHFRARQIEPLRGASSVVRPKGPSQVSRIWSI
jgi:hypothetical protein